MTARLVIFLDSKSVPRERRVMKSQVFTVAEEQRDQFWPAMYRRAFHLQPDLHGFATQGRRPDPDIVGFACHSAFCCTFREFRKNVSSHELALATN